MGVNPALYVGDDAVARLADYCRAKGIDRILLVADQNTYRALGERVEQALRGDVDVRTVLLRGEEIVADENRIVQVLVRATPQDGMYLAVGGGTVTDIARFVSHRTKSNFISVPTAPSVDGFPSIGAPVVVGGLKQTFITQPPIAIFVDLPTIAAAPKQLVAAGLGDMVGKLTSVADWEIGRLLWNEPFDATIARRSRIAGENCLGLAEAIGQGSQGAIRTLMEALIESGLCMLEFGSSRPASGSEHHYSHYWEMKLLWEHRPALLHGAKVGVASILIAQEYDRLRSLSYRDVVELLGRARLPDRDAEIRRIGSAYGSSADQVIQDQLPFLDMSPRQFDELKQRVLAQWTHVQEVAGRVPSSQQIIKALEKAGAPTTPYALGLSDEEVTLAREYAHYLRDRFTVRKLSFLLGLDARNK